MESLIENYLGGRHTLMYMNMTLGMYHPCKGVAREAGNDVVCYCSQHPRRVKSSERLRPKALTWIRTWPFAGVGIGRVSSLRDSGGPGSWRTTALMVAIEQEIRAKFGEIGRYLLPRKMKVAKRAIIELWT